MHLLCTSSSYNFNSDSIRFINNKYRLNNIKNYLHVTMRNYNRSSFFSRKLASMNGYKCLLIVLFLVFFFFKKNRNRQNCNTNCVDG